VNNQDGRLARSGVGVVFDSCAGSGLGEGDLNSAEFLGVMELELEPSDVSDGPRLCVDQSSPRGGSWLRTPLGVKERFDGGSELSPASFLLQSASSLAPRPCFSSMTASTLRSLESDLREGGWEFRRDVIGGEIDLVRGGEIDRGGDTARGGGISAHAEFDSDKYPPEVGIQVILEGLVAISEVSMFGVDELWGLGEDDGAFAITESGGKIEKI